MEQNITTPETLVEAVRFFADPDVCLSFMVQLRWPDGNVTCPTCGSHDVWFLPNQRRWKCRENHERKQFSIKVGTIFEDSPIPLEKWLPAVWLIVNAKIGISSYEIHRALGVTQKSAWFMLHRIRLAMQRGTFSKPLSGHVEIDETFIGGKARNMHRGDRARKIHGTGGSGKVAVMGLLERHGEVRTMVVPNVRRRSLDGEVRKHVETGSTVYSDALPAYAKLEDEYIHNVINHSEEYVRGHIHTNGIEN